MAKCLKCGSTELDRLNVELSFARGLLTPVYSVGQITVCLACGFAEYPVPQESLAQLRQGSLGFWERTTAASK